MNESESWARTALRGVITLMFGTLIISVLNYAFKYVLASELTVHDFGLYYAIIALLSFLDIFRKLGMSDALTKILPEYIVEKKYQLVKTATFQVLNIQTLAAVIFYGGIIAGASFLARQYFHEPSATPIILLISLSHIIRSPQMASFALLRSYAKFRLMSIARVLRAAVMLVSTLWLLHLGIYGPVFANLITPTLLGILHYYWLRKYIVPTWKNARIDIFNKSTMKGVLDYSIPSVLSSTATILMNNVDIIMLTFITGVVSVAQYNVIAPIAALATFISAAMIEVFVPYISRLKKQNHIERIRAGTDMMYRLILATLIPAIIAVALNAEYVLRVLFGDKYVIVGLELILYAITVIFTTLFSVSSNLLVASGKPRYVAKLTWMILGINIILNSIFIPLYGLLGAVITTMISFMCMGSLAFIEVYKEYNMTRRLLHQTKLLVAIIVFTTIFLFAKSQIMQLITYGIIAGVCYIVCLYKFEYITLKEIKKLYTLARHGKDLQRKV